MKLICCLLGLSLVKVVVSLVPSTTKKRIRSIDAVNKDSEEKKRVIFCLGGPGAGKGTQCELLEKEYGLVHLSAGELLRRERLSGTKDGDLIETYLSEGKIVPVALSLGLLRKEMEKNAPNDIYIIDGFPRNQDNLDGWNDLMTHFANVEAVLFYDIPTQVMIERMISRGETSGRSDDNLAAAQKRITTFRESTMPILKYFATHPSIKLITVPGVGSVEEVWTLTKAALEPILSSQSSQSRVQIQEQATAAGEIALLG